MNHKAAHTDTETKTPPAPVTPPETTPVTESATDAIVPIGVEKLKKLEEAAAQADVLRDRLLRTQADWDNYRKRSIREKEEAVKYASENVLEKLLPVLDSFEMGLQAAQTATEAKHIAEGMQMIFNQFQTLLKDLGVETIDAVGQPFDPHRHEALCQQESDKHEEGTVLGQMRKGYKLKDRLLRPASVFVAKKPELPQA
jgi:molecular chaperone GrpE